MSAKVMFSFPDQLVIRMRAMIPSRDRSRIVAILLEKEIAAREKNLYLRAKELEESAGLGDEMTVWEKEFSQDGLDDDAIQKG